jgi:hypothetical protein
MAVKDRKWWKAMEPRREMIRQKGRENDRAFMLSLGSMEQALWHEGRKQADPEHLNPYDSADRFKLISHAKA